MCDIDSKEILLVDKPKGISSFDVIRQLRTELGVRKIGHAGTLDPLASGLMILGVGEATKLLINYLKLDKTYDVHVLLGVQTETGDMEGKVLEETKIPKLDPEDAKNVLQGIVGVLKLPVPRYSAIKQDGQPLYKRARRGEKFDPPTKEMTINTITSHNILYENDTAILHLTMNVGSGAYVRSIAEEIGKRLGYPATVKELRRTRIGKYRVEDARKI